MRRARRSSTPPNFSRSDSNARAAGNVLKEMIQRLNAADGCFRTVVEEERVKPAFEADAALVALEEGGGRAEANAEANAKAKRRGGERGVGVSRGALEQPRDANGGDSGDGVSRVSRVSRGELELCRRHERT